MLHIINYLTILEKADNILKSYGTYPDTHDEEYDAARQIYELAFGMLLKTGIPFEHKGNTVTISTDGREYRYVLSDDTSYSRENTVTAERREGVPSGVRSDEKEIYLATEPKVNGLYGGTAKNTIKTSRYIDEDEDVSVDVPVEVDEEDIYPETDIENETGEEENRPDPEAAPAEENEITDDNETDEALREEVFSGSAESADTDTEEIEPEEQPEDEKNVEEEAAFSDVAEIQNEEVSDDIDADEVIDEERKSDVEEPVENTDGGYDGQSAEIEEPGEDMLYKLEEPDDIDEEDIDIPDLTEPEGEPFTEEDLEEPSGQDDGYGTEVQDNKEHADYINASEQEEPAETDVAPEAIETEETETMPEERQMPAQMYREDFTMGVHFVEIWNDRNPTYDRTGKETFMARTQILTMPISIDVPNPRILVGVSSKKEGMNMYITKRGKDSVVIDSLGIPLIVTGRMEDGEYVTTCDIKQEYKDRGYRLVLVTKTYGHKGHVVMDEDEHDFHIHIMPVGFDNAKGKGYGHFCYLAENTGDISMGSTINTNGRARFRVGNKEYFIRVVWDEREYGPENKLLLCHCNEREV